MLRPLQSTLFAFLALLLVGPPLSAEEDTTLYFRTAFGEAGSITADYESALGSREARPFGEQGVEQGVRIRYRPMGRVTVETWGGVLFTEAGYAGGAGAVEAHLGVIDQGETSPVAVTVSVGGMLDYQQVLVPRARLTVHREQGLWDLTASSLVEVPLSEVRDEVDLIVGLAALRPVGGGVHLGAEVMGEDLEGFWEEDEAEGGAKLVAGPTAFIPITQHLRLKGNVSAVIPATQNVPTRVEDGVVIPNEPGVLARVALGGVF